MPAASSCSRSRPCSRREVAAEHGADILVAQGGEAGGYGGVVSTLSLVPQVVDAVRPLPVVAAGGIADGRGIAAVMVLGAAGVNLGSRFLAAAESPVGERWKKALVTRPSEDWIQSDFINALNPNPGTVGYGTRVRLLRTEFVERWEERVDEVTADPKPVLAELIEADAAGDRERLLVVGGQSAGLIATVEPAGDIVRALVAEGASRARRRRRGRALRAVAPSRTTREGPGEALRLQGAEGARVLLPVEEGVNSPPSLVASCRDRQNCPTSVVDFVRYPSVFDHRRAGVGRSLRSEPRVSDTLIPSAPRVEVRRRAAAQHPSHERPVIGTIAQSSDQPGKGPVDELLRPVIRCEADSEIHTVYLDLPPPMEGQLCNRMLTALQRSDLVIPEIIRQ